MEINAWVQLRDCGGQGAGDIEASRRRPREDRGQAGPSHVWGLLVGLSGVWDPRRASQGGGPSAGLSGCGTWVSLGMGLSAGLSGCGTLGGSGFGVLPPQSLVCSLRICILELVSVSCTSTPKGGGEAAVTRRVPPPSYHGRNLVFLVALDPLVQEGCSVH